MENDFPPNDFPLSEFPAPETETEKEKDESAENLAAEQPLSFELPAQDGDLNLQSALDSSIPAPAQDFAPAEEFAPAQETAPAPEPVLATAEPMLAVAAAAEAAAAAPDALAQVREFSEQVSLSQAVVPAAFPFSLMITGQLTDYDKARLLDVISRENMGFREVDLEPQLEAGRILIPRISEYAGVLIIQALRGASVEMAFGPADQIFSTEDTREPAYVDASQGETRFATRESGHPAEGLTITSDTALPHLPDFVVVDLIVASAALKTQSVEAERSAEYLNLLEALNRELKYKAFRKGATAILNYTAELSSLSLPSHYRLTVMGSAVRGTQSLNPPDRDAY